ncbi:hypothetical protein Cob_v001528 [Colletotrichum orbiculare MAFF 240422]|uniref:Uncharacterized protein n=1 Tax=Colletotrichum orbiculare (strain 104-T / ATCC 96160 / CBS 514.97 / LARS 414 / MAFF 240422) TaxID=1213857 RepID=A0A484G4Q3_COLOR|nr:hypothetical protein Cob_v001528 [Colletotrichum orbiculare MAFF 240422]
MPLPTSRRAATTAPTAIPAIAPVDNPVFSATPPSGVGFRPYSGNGGCLIEIGPLAGRSDKETFLQDDHNVDSVPPLVAMLLTQTSVGVLSMLTQSRYGVPASTVRHDHDPGGQHHVWTKVLALARVRVVLHAVVQPLMQAVPGKARLGKSPGAGTLYVSGKHCVGIETVVSSTYSSPRQVAPEVRDSGLVWHRMSRGYVGQSVSWALNAVV